MWACWSFYRWMPKGDGLFVKYKRKGTIDPTYWSGCGWRSNLMSPKPALYLPADSDDDQTAQELIVVRYLALGQGLPTLLRASQPYIAMKVRMGARTYPIWPTDPEVVRYNVRNRNCCWRERLAWYSVRIVWVADPSCDAEMVRVAFRIDGTED